MPGPWEKYSAVPDAEAGPWTQYAPPKAEPKHSVGEKATAALEGFGQGALSGYLPNIQAAVEPVTDALFNISRRTMRGGGQALEENPKTYVERRDQNIRRQFQEAKEMPGQFYGGMIGGTVASAPLYGKALSAVPGLRTPSPGLLKGTAQAAEAGAIQGLIQNPGDTEGELSSLQVPERFQNAKLGAMTGAATNVAGQALKKTSDFILSTPERLKEWAELKAAKSAGMMLKDYRAMNARSPSGDPEARVREIGNQMIKNGLVKPGYTFDDVAEKSLDLKAKAGSVIGDVYDTASQELAKLTPRSVNSKERALILKTALNPKDWSEELSAQFGKSLKGKAGGGAAMKAVQSTLDELAENGNQVNLLKVQEFKSDLDGLINYNKKFDDTPLKNEYLYKIRSFIDKKIKDRISALDKILGSDKLETLKEANHQYGVWSEVNRISQDRVNRESANRFASLTDTIAGVGGVGAGAVTGAMMKGDVEGALEGGALGAGLGVANHLARRYGNPVAVTGANAVARKLQSVPRPLVSGAEFTGGLLSRDPRLTGSITSRLVNPPKNQKGLIP